MQFISPSIAAIVLFTNPLWVTLLSSVMLSERLTLWKLVSLATGVAGVVLTIGVRGSGEWRGYALSFAGSVSWALATIVTKRCKTPGNAWITCFWQMAFGSLALLVLARSAGEIVPSIMTTREVAWFVWLAIPASAWSFGLWFYGSPMGRGGAQFGFSLSDPCVHRHVVFHRTAHDDCSHPGDGRGTNRPVDILHESQHEPPGRFNAAERVPRGASN